MADESDSDHTDEEHDDDDYSPSSSESSSEEEEDANRQVLLKLCDENAHKLTFLLTCSKEEFEAHDNRKSFWWEILGVPKPDIPREVTTKISTLRELFQANSFLVDTGPSFARTLGMLGKVQCSICRLHNTRDGKMQARKGVVSKHPQDGAHRTHLASHNAAQLRLDEMHAFVEGAGGEQAIRKRLMALAVGKFVAGGEGCAGIPPSSLPRHFSTGVWSLLHELETGFPAPSTILESTLQDAVELVEKRLGQMLRGVKLTLYIDGGKSHLAYGRKVMVVCASSLEWEHDILLDVLILEGHESGETNADQIEALCKKYSIDKLDVWCVNCCPPDA